MADIHVATAATPDGLSYRIRVYANCDHVYLVWRPARVIPACRGFAVYRKRADTDPAMKTTLDTWLGFAGEDYQSGSRKPSTQWPVQRFLWSDFTVESGTSVQYSVAPVVREASGGLRVYDEWASPWSDPVSVTPRVNETMAAYFNRGILACQWVAEQLQGYATAHNLPSLGASLDAALSDAASPLRSLLSGALRDGLLQDVLGATSQPGGDLYGALFELDAGELIDGLIARGARAHLILTNGSPDKAHHETDENAKIRARLEHAGAPLVDLSNRIVNTNEHLGHNKFIVACDAQGSPQRVWTGSTNWTTKGLCTQANNGLLITHPAVARMFKAQWDRLHAAGDGFPPALAPNDPARDVAEMQATYDTGQGQATVTVWFAPTLPGAKNAPLDQYPDLHFVRERIEQARQGILFLMFMPGPRDTLLDVIQGIAERNSTLVVRGALNQDPGAGGQQTSPYVALLHRGVWQRTTMDVVLPATVPQSFAKWVPELLKANQAHAMVHSKTIVIDPFGAHPVVVTGSHNLGPKASRANDDNLVVIEGDAALARAYAVNIMGVYDKYSWRYHQSVPDQFVKAGAGVDPTDPNAPTIPPPDGTLPATPATGAAAQHQTGWKGLQDNDSWQGKYFDAGAAVPELQFWLGT